MSVSLPESSGDKQLSKELHLPTTTHKCKSSAVDGFVFVSSLLHLKSLMNNLSPPSNDMSSTILNMQHKSFTYSSCQSFQSEGWMSVPISGNTTGGLETSAEPFAATATQNSSWIWNWRVIGWEPRPQQRNEDSGATSDSPEKDLAPPDHTTPAWQAL